jgi:hypothetical protein
MKIAFAFLITDEINREESWFNFFNNSNLDYEIIIHSKLELKLKYLIDITNNIYINEVETNWSKLQKVQNFLIEKAKDLNCDKVILLSNSCLPLKSIDYIFNYLNNNKNYISYSKPWWREDRKSNFIYVMGNHQWCIIDKLYYDIILSDEDRYFYENYVIFPEESYFSSILNKNGLLNEENVVNIKTTFVDWNRSPNGKSPYEFSDYNEFDKNLISKLKLDNNLLFIRKVNKNLNTELYGL